MPIDIEAARAVIAKATPGEWCVQGPWPHATAAFIAAARTGWPAALDEVERLRGEHDNFALCLSCGRCSIDEDGCCATCGCDAVLVQDGKTFGAPCEYADTIERMAKRIANLRDRLAAVTAARDRIYEIAKTTFALHLMTPELAAELDQLRTAGSKGTK